MYDILKLQQKIVPEMIELLQKRYNILRTIYYNQPIGRRILADELGVGERIVRTEINFLKEQGLIKINTPGMSITSEGEDIISRLKDFIHELKGLSEIEKIIKDKLGIKDIVIVPGDIDEDKTILNELGKAAANHFKGLIKNGYTVAITGGSTIKEVIDNIPKVSNLKDVLVVPARGGIGRNVETQANNLAASLAKKIGSSYKLLHVPDNLSDNALNTILNEKDIKEIVDNIHHADVLLYGIGRACKMAKRRGLSEEKIDELSQLGAVGEAFGYYFNNKGKVIYSTPVIGIGNEDVKKIKNSVAVAAGKSKAEAIVAIEIHNSNSILITDEGAAREIINILNKKE
ncbi:MAG: sugar-binding transcriptional regulator [Bacillota bacterium]|nr:sugar-binding transcriptional regulator [Bacillota bacterium]